MSCVQVQALMPMAALDLLDEDERTLLEGHVVECEPCRARRSALEGAFARLADPLPDPEPAPATWEKVIARIEAATPDAAGKLEEPAPALEDERPPEDDAAPTIALACVSCHGALRRDEAVYCASCLAPQHDDCFAAHGACAAPGCGERLVVRPLGDGEPRPPRRRLGWIVTTGLSAVLGSAAALAAWDAWAPRVDRPARAVPRRTTSRGCAECDRPGDPTLPPLRLEGEAEPAFCDAAHRRQFLIRRALEQRTRQLQARVVSVGADPGVTRIDVGLRGGVAPGDQFALWRSGDVVGRLTIDGAEDDAAWGSVDLVTGWPEAGDSAVRVDEREFWTRLAEKRAAQERVAAIAERAGRPRVLYVEGVARWEYQHLRRVLTRWTRAQVWLASADPGFVQDASPGMTPLQQLPSTLDGYDVVILGAGARRAASALYGLKEFVRRGGGLVLAPGSPGPRDLTGDAYDLSPVHHAFGSGLAPSDEELKEYRFGRALEQARGMFGGRVLPALQATRPGRVREGALVQLEDARGQPVIVTWSVSSGRVAYVGAEDLWRWRRSAGEEPHAALWLEVIAWAAGRGAF